MKREWVKWVTAWCIIVSVAAGIVIAMKKRDADRRASWERQRQIVGDVARGQPFYATSWDYTNYSIYSNTVYYPDSHSEEASNKIQPPAPLTDIVIARWDGTNTFMVDYSSRLIGKWLRENASFCCTFQEMNGMRMQLTVNPCYSAEGVRAWIESGPWR